MFTKRALPHIPFILTLQEGDPPEHYKRRVGLLAPLYKKIFKQADVIQVISEFLAGYGREMGYEGEPVVIPNGVTVEHFAEKPPEKNIQKLRDKLSKRDGEVYLVTVSRLVKKNAVDDIIRSLTHLPPHIKLIVLGEGPLGKWLWHLAGKLGVLKRLLFRGHVSHEELPLYLYASDIFVRPSRSEGMGNVFIEAMAAGLPVVGTKVGGITDFLFDPEQTKMGKITPTGLFCNVDDPKSIAESVMRLIDDKKLRERIIANASAMVKEKYDWDTLAQKMYELVFSITSQTLTTKFGGGRKTTRIP